MALRTLFKNFEKEECQSIQINYKGHVEYCGEDWRCDICQDDEDDPGEVILEFCFWSEKAKKWLTATAKKKEFFDIKSLLKIRSQAEVK